MTNFCFGFPEKIHWCTLIPETFRFMACEFTFTIRVRVTNSDKACKKPPIKVRRKDVFCKRIVGHFPESCWSSSFFREDFNQGLPFHVLLWISWLRTHFGRKMKTKQKWIGENCCRANILETLLAGKTWLKSWAQSFVLTVSKELLITDSLSFWDRKNAWFDAHFSVCPSKMFVCCVMRL